jgi:hypothetical protein
MPDTRGEFLDNKYDNLSMEMLAYHLFIIEYNTW